jgi:signal transduction histidine kinase
LLRLINQLLDYRKVEDKKFILRASIANLFDFQIIIADFEREAKKLNIDFFSNKQPDLEVYIDRNLMDKYTFNLLSNAFKFTPAKVKFLL